MSEKRGLICPICSVKNEGAYMTTECGQCKKCKSYTIFTGYNYCQDCSSEMTKCMMCCDDFKPGKEYIADLEDLYWKKMDMFRERIERYPMSKETYLKRMKEIEERIPQLKSMYEAKTIEEIISESRI